MRTKNLTLGLAIILASCVRPPSARQVPTENDRSIVFPRFFERPVVEVGAGGEPYELDGVALQALMIAANDFLPLGSGKRPCWDRQEAHRYRIIRQGDILFVRIDEDLEACGLKYVSLDTGATYAISTDGRILRRVFDGQPDDAPLHLEADAGTQEASTAAGVPLPVPPGPDAGVGAPESSSPGTDAGTAAPSSPDAGVEASS